MVGKLASLMLIKIIIEKYVDPSVLMVTTIIKNIYIPNNLIGLGIVDNVMMMETMQNFTDTHNIVISKNI